MNHRSHQKGPDEVKSSRRSYTDMQVSGNFKSWARSMKDHLFWHDRSFKELTDYFDGIWVMDQKLSH